MAAEPRALRLVVKVILPLLRAGEDLRKCRRGDRGQVGSVNLRKFCLLQTICFWWS